MLTPESKILKEVSDYWEVRADSYSQQNLAELHCFKREAWLKLIIENAPPSERLRVLDIGTGPGFFAINLASAGHDVTAVDLTSAMLERAAENAIHYGVKICLEQSNVHTLPFVDGKFDLVISRNVVWNLEEPERALREWARVLSPKGRLLYFDANWYHYLYDQQHRAWYEAAHQEAERLYPQQVIPGKATGAKMETIAKQLPLFREHRPQWDRKVLENMGMNILRLEEVGELVWDEQEKVRYAGTRMFMVCAEVGKTGKAN